MTDKNGGDVFLTDVELAYRGLMLDLSMYRARCDITQKDLIYLTGLSRRDIRSIEGGDSNPPLKSFIRYLRGLGLRIEIKEVEN